MVLRRESCGNVGVLVLTEADAIRYQAYASGPALEALALLAEG